MAEVSFQTEEVAARLEGFLKPLLAAGNFRLTFEIQRSAGRFQRDYETPELIVNFSGADSDLLLSNRGELLRALEHVSLEAIRVEGHEKILFDCQDYRLLRIEELGLAAQAAADKVRRTGVPYKFSPMSSRERRVIHMVLRGDAEVRTESEGIGPGRQVVVYPKQSSAPVNPMRRRR